MSEHNTDSRAVFRCKNLLKRLGQKKHWTHFYWGQQKDRGSYLQGLPQLPKHSCLLEVPLPGFRRKLPQSSWSVYLSSLCLGLLNYKHKKRRENHARWNLLLFFIIDEYKEKSFIRNLPALFLTWNHLYKQPKWGATVYKLPYES